MSNGKRFMLPTQKGIELFPNVTQQPTKLVIKNVPPQTPLYHAVASQFAGRLKSFHTKAQQGYAISDNQQYKVSWSWSDARAIYINQFGNETLVLEVSQSVLEQLSAALKKKVPWDWFLLEYHIPLTGAAQHADLRARRTIPAPHEAGITNGAVVQDGRFPPDNVDGLHPPVTQYPSATPVFSTSRSDNVQVSSLAVDLRRFNGAPVTININGTLEVDSSSHEEVTGYFGESMTSVQTFGQTYSGSWDLNTFDNTWTATLFPGDIYAYSATGVRAVPATTGFEFVSVEDAPKAPRSFQPSNSDGIIRTGDQGDYPNDLVAALSTRVANYSSLVYDPDSGILLSFVYDGIECNGFSSSGQIGGDGHLHDFGHYSYNVVSVNYSREVETETDTVADPIPTTCLGPMRFIGGFGVPPWVSVEVTGSVTYFDQFAVMADATYKFLPTAMLRDNVPISGGIDLPADDPDADLIGVLTIDPMTYSAGFKPAT